MMWKPGSDKPAPKKQPKASAKDAAGKNDAAPAASNTARPSTKSALSQKTLAMKFMQRKKNGAEQRRVALEEQQREDTWERPEAMADDDDSDRLVCVRDVPDPSVPAFFGRRSFGGFNKAVEDEYRDVTRSAKFAAAEERERREEVSAEEMASRMVKYTGLMRGRNAGGPPRGKKKARHA
ncbi:hypothetical protein P43SY_006010 [Pythium insidiosum]|uniref:M-phase phosphoprotein 6 n=1 Tax=Pythium insidiosum TaxID=114742 RepID=A0AAD5M238_PYTIN|nr:hypothetical protein P43SY_006010 [Pythium insidiosum]